jgi:hypothetical protein
MYSGSTLNESDACRLSNCSTRLLMPSTRELERPLAGRHQRKPSTSTCNQFNKEVLHPPVELSQFTSEVFTGILKEAGVAISMDGQEEP